MSAFWDLITRIPKLRRYGIPILRFGIVKRNYFRKIENSKLRIMLKRIQVTIGK